MPEAASYYSLEASTITWKFPEPGYLEGVKTKDKAILKMTGMNFAYPGADKNILNDVNVQVRTLLFMYDQVVAISFFDQAEGEDKCWAPRHRTVCLNVLLVQIFCCSSVACALLMSQSASMWYMPRTPAADFLERIRQSQGAQHGFVQPCVFAELSLRNFQNPVHVFLGLADIGPWLCP